MQDIHATSKALKEICTRLEGVGNELDETYEEPTFFITCQPECRWSTDSIARLRASEMGNVSYWDDIVCDIYKNHDLIKPIEVKVVKVWVGDAGCPVNTIQLSSGIQLCQEEDRYLWAFNENELYLKEGRADGFNW